MIYAITFMGAFEAVTAAHDGIGKLRRGFALPYSHPALLQANSHRSRKLRFVETRSILF